ncbi:MAG: hypothetical protein KDB23_34020, partial [Planctomycetales bacterium]|nr:hypothetical protein [Planctomycetales bacterium]
IVRWSSSVAWTNVMVGDIDDDGRDDIVGRAGGTWYASHLKNGSYTTEVWEQWDAAINWVDVSIGDLE